MRADNILRENHILPEVDFDLTLVNDILSITMKRLDTDFKSYYDIDTWYYGIHKNIDQKFLKEERYPPAAIKKILEFLNQNNGTD